MKKLFSAFLTVTFLTIFAGSAFAGDVWVKPYIRKNGTYVQPHYRTKPDRNIWNNYSAKGNINPYTGKKGYVTPYKTPGLKSHTYKSKSFKTPRYNSYKYYK